MSVEHEQGSPIVKGVYHLFLGNITYTLLLAVTAIVVGRMLGPDNLGLYTVALIVPPFLFTVIRLGLDSAATRYSAKLMSEGREEDAVSFVFTMTIFGVAIGTISSLVFVGLSGWIAATAVDRPQLGTVVIPIAMVSVMGQAAYFITDLGMTGLGKFDRAGQLQALQGAVKLVVSVGLVMLGFALTGAVAGYTASYVVSGALGVGYIARLTHGKLPKGMRFDFGVGLRYGLPIYLSTLAGGFVGPVLSVVLALTVSNFQIGGYTAAGTFTTLIALFTYPISTALFPLFSRKADDRKALADIYQISVRYTALLVIPVTVFIIAFSGPMIVTVFGSAYSFAALYLALYAAASLLTGVGGLAWNSLLNGIGRTRDSLWTVALGSAVSVVSGVSLIELIGVAGAIAGQIVGATVSLAVGTWMVRKRLEARLGLNRVWKFYVASAVAGVLSWPLSWFVHPPELAMVCGAAMYAILFVPALALMRALDETDMNLLKSYLSFSSVVSAPLKATFWYYRLVMSSLWPGRPHPTE